MVNLGKSFGCLTCKQRRIKCDETDPACKRCQKSGLTCPGYDTGKRMKIRFKDETALVTRRAEADLLRKTASRPPVALQEDVETRGLNFFIINFAKAGRDKDSSRGLWENVVPTLNAVSITSPAADAAIAVGGILLNIWQLYRDGPKARNHAFQRAIRGLRLRLESSKPINGPEVLLTILLLQFHENVAAVCGLRPASRIHYNGAVAFIRNLPTSTFSTVEARGLLFNILNIEVSLAIRECQPVDPELVPWFQSLPYSMPSNPATKLCYIGISVANIQHQFESILRDHIRCSRSDCIHSAEITKLYQDILDFQIKSSEWLKDIPKHWMPEIWHPSGEQSDPPTPMYQNRCEVFPSVQIASIFNTWRGYRLIICKILSIMHTHAWLLPSKGPPTRFPPHENVQSLVDSMCYSIPFYLGNCTDRHGLADLTDPRRRHFYPAYHNMRDPPIPKEHILSEKSHTQHVAAYGTWHSLYPLTLLITLLGKHSGYDCDCLARALRPGQLTWIGSQLLRTMILFGLDLGPEAMTVNDPEKCAKNMRRALRCVYRECILQCVGFPDEDSSFVTPVQAASSFDEAGDSFDVWRRIVEVS